MKTADGRIVWDNDSYKFLAGEAPDTVNPSLWRQSISQGGWVMPDVAGCAV